MPVRKERPPCVVCNPDNAGAGDYCSTHREELHRLDHQYEGLFRLQRTSRGKDHETYSLYLQGDCEPCARVFVTETDPENKALKKGAYFNLDILTFTVNAGQTTTLEVHPVIHKTSTFFVKFFVPELAVTVTENGVLGVERVINERTSESIAWEDYTGPLKF